MTLSLYSIKKFDGDCGLSLSVQSNRDAGNDMELTKIVNSLIDFYKQELASNEISINMKEEFAKDGGYLYEVKYKNSKHGTVKINPKGRFFKNAKPDPDIDFPTYPDTKYYETYWIYFFPIDRSRRAKERDAYIQFLDPNGIFLRKRPPKDSD